MSQSIGVYRVWTVKIEEGESGLWFATTETEPPMFLSTVGLEDLLKQLPEILRRTIKPGD